MSLSMLVRNDLRLNIYQRRIQVVEIGVLISIMDSPTPNVRYLVPPIIIKMNKDMDHHLRWALI